MQAFLASRIQTREFYPRKIKFSSMIHLPQFLSQRTNDQHEKRRAREDYQGGRSNSGGSLDRGEGEFKKSIHERAKPQEPQSEKSSPPKEKKKRYQSEESKT